MKSSIICLLLLCYWCNCELKDGDIYICEGELCGKCVKFQVGYDNDKGYYDVCLECSEGSETNYKKVPWSKINEKNTLGSQGCGGSGKGLLIALIVVSITLCCVCMLFIICKLCCKDGALKIKFCASVSYNN